MICNKAIVSHDVYMCVCVCIICMHVCMYVCMYAYITCNNVIYYAMHFFVMDIKCFDEQIRELEPT